MKMPEEPAAASRKTLPSRKARKVSAPPSTKPELMEKPAKRKAILKKGSDIELVKKFGNH